jgi:uncharacterized protein (UPF0335 family)
MSEILEQRVKQLEESAKAHTEDIKELQRNQNSHAITIAEIKVIVDSMRLDWQRLEEKIDKAMDSQNNGNTTAWKEVMIETLKTLGLVVGAILAAKIFMG